MGDLSKQYSHLNIDGLSLWYQMSQRPKFYQTFEALLKVRNQFVGEFFLKTVAYEAFHYMFNNKDVVTKSVLGFLPIDQANLIYSDQFLGMDQPSKLFYWLQALQQQQGSYMYNLIMAYFNQRNVPLNDTSMSMILGPQNMLAQVYNSLTSLGYKLYQNDSSNIFDQDALWQRQWGNSSIFNDTRIFIGPNIPQVYWFKDLDPDNIIGNPEFSYYV